MALLSSDAARPTVGAPSGHFVQWDPGFAYLMTGIALGCILVSGVLVSIFTPDLITTSGTSGGGTALQHVPLAAYMGWVFYVGAIAMVLPTAIKGIRAKVIDRAPWIVLGLGASGIWLAVMFISIFTPTVVSGTAPWLTWNPLAMTLSVIAGLIVTWLLCRTIKSASFEPALSERTLEASTEVRTLVPEHEDDDAVTKLRRLAQLRDSGVITEAEFQRKKDELLSRI
jgi:Short C-terminal domain